MNDATFTVFKVTQSTLLCNSISLVVRCKVLKIEPRFGRFLVRNYASKYISGSTPFKRLCSGLVFRFQQRGFTYATVGS